MASKIRIRQDGIKLMTKTDVAVWTRKVTDEVTRHARGHAPGRIAGSIRLMAFRASSYRVRARVGTNTGYGLFPEEGTGIYGPTGRRIYPKTAKVLVFRPRGSSQLVFAKSVKGQKPQHFMLFALNHAIIKMAIPITKEER